MKSRHTIAGAVMVVAGLPLLLASCSDASIPALTQASNGSHGTSARSALVAAPHAEAAVRRLFTVVGEVDLRPEQQATYQAMAADIEAKYGATDGARSSLLEAVAKQAEAGAIDRGALQPSIDAFQAALAEERASNHAALTQFGAVLTRPQREQTLRELSLVGAPGDDDEGVAVDGPKVAFAPLHRSLARGLGLDREQRSLFIAARVELTADARAGKLVGFDATRIGRRVRLLERVLPSLRSQQQVALARNLRERASALAVQPLRAL